jgi:hypothetical protein
VGVAFFDETGIGIKVCPPSCVPHHEQAQNLPNFSPQGTSRGIRDAALIGLLLGCVLSRSEASLCAWIRFNNGRNTGFSRTWSAKVND